MPFRRFQLLAFLCIWNHSPGKIIENIDFSNSVSHNSLLFNRLSDPTAVRESDFALLRLDLSFSERLFLLLDLLLTLLKI